MTIKWKGSGVNSLNLSKNVSQLKKQVPQPPSQLWCSVVGEGVGFVLTFCCHLVDLTSLQQACCSGA